MEAITSRASIAQHGVYFYFHEDSFLPKNLHYSSECLATGLKQLNIPLFSNLSGDLFQTKDIEVIGPHLYLFHLTDQSYSLDLIESIALFPVEPKLLISMADSSKHMITPPEIPFLVTHENRFLQVMGKRIPWAFGLSQTILEATASVLPVEQRQTKVLRNFNPSLNQSVRTGLDLAFIPHLQRYFEIDWQISTNHVDKLTQYFGCVAYGGHMMENLLRNDFFASQPAYQATGEHFTYLQEPVIDRWDSWRFWESLAAGCVTFHLDFEKYGFQLPVMPNAWEHYVAIDLEDPKGTVERLMDERDRLPELAANGRRWAREHYSPSAVAQRFLSLVTSLSPYH